MAELTELESKLGEVPGLAQAAKDATQKVKKLVDDDELQRRLEIVREMHAVVQLPGLAQVADEVLPIQERHFREAREASLALARSEATGWRVRRRGRVGRSCDLTRARLLRLRCRPLRARGGRATGARGRGARLAPGPRRGAGPGIATSSCAD